MYAYYQKINSFNKINKDELHMVSGLSFSNLIPMEISPKYIDITCLPNLYELPLKALAHLLHIESSCELIRKYGGVYNKNHYIRRIMENLNIDRPVIARNLRNDGFWNLISNYDRQKDSIIITSLENNDTWCVNNWYENVEEIFLVGSINKPFVKPINMQSLLLAPIHYKQYGVGKYYMGRQAHGFVLQLLIESKNLEAVTDFVIHYVKQLLINRFRVIRFIDNLSSGEERVPDEFIQIHGFISCICKLCYELINKISDNTFSDVNIKNNFIQIFEMENNMFLFIQNIIDTSPKIHIKDEYL